MDENTEAETGRRARNPRGSGERLREELIRAAIALVDETDDAAALTLRGIARRAGISAPSIYAHFGDLPALLDAMLAESFSGLTATVHRAMDRASGPTERLLAAAGAYVRFGWDHRARYRLMFAESGYAENAVELFELVAEAIGDVAEAGASESADPRADTWMIWASLHGVATLDKPARSEQRRLGPLDRTAMLEEIVRRLARIRD